MGPTPDQLKEDIDRARAELTANVDSLADRVSPKRIVQRKASSARTRATAVKDRVMGAASQSTGDTLSSGAGTVSSTARDLPNRAAAGAQGNPLAAGLIAFGAGMLVASLLPETDAESHAAVQLRERAGGMAAPVVDAAKESAQHVKDAVVPAAQTAAQEMKDTAVQAVEQTKDQAKGAASQVASDTKDSAAKVKSTAAPSRARSKAQRPAAKKSGRTRTTRGAK